MTKKTDTRRDDKVGGGDKLSRNDTLGTSDPLSGNATRGRDDNFRRDTLGRDDKFQSDAHKSPERLEREVDEARARVGRTANELSDRLSPGELLDQALGMAREHGGEFASNLGATVKNNPMPLILTTVGVSWMMMSSKSGAARRYGYNEGYADTYGDRYGDTYGGSDAFGRPDAFTASGSDAYGGPDTYSSSEGKSLKDKVSDKVSGAAEKSRERAAAVGDRIHGTADNLRYRAQHAKDNVRYSAQHARDSLADFYREQPLLAGSLGVAIGAALGAMMPTTEREDELLGHARDRAVESAKSKAAMKYEEARESARSSNS
jgi:ElaB/YqjD/DUF883 family membrane-anchored ribosome-binding protein